MAGAPGAVTVIVSEERARLRDAQKKLNWFLWSTELAYGSTLTSNDSRLSSSEARVSEALEDVHSQAWYPNHMGNLHYDARLETFREQLSRNVIYVYRAVLISWYAYFEYFLEERVRPFLSKGVNWGPLTRSLCIPSLRSAKFQLRPRTVVLADLARLVRNELVHQAFIPIDSIQHSKVASWRESTIAALRDMWDIREPSSLVDDAIDFVIPLALRQQASAAERGDSLPIEYFYTLYSFSNLDKLAFEIEEALLPSPPLAVGRMERHPRHIRRKDLITTPDAADNEYEL